MDGHNTIPSTSFQVDHAANVALGSGAVSVKPHISVKGTTFTIKLTVSIPTHTDTQTFVLSHANHWTDQKTFFSWPMRTEVRIAVDRKRKVVQVHVEPPVGPVINKSFPYEALEMPGDFEKWSPHTGAEYDHLQELIGRCKPIKKSPGLKITEDAKGVAERCEFLGAPDFTKHATHALKSDADAALTNTSGSKTLFALGLVADASTSVGLSANGGFWWTDDGACGLYGGGGAQMGSVVGANLQAIYTVVIARGGKSAIENFEQYHIARGIVGEGLTASFALLGDIAALEIYGMMYGGGIGGGTPAGGYVGASRQALLNF